MSSEKVGKTINDIMVFEHEVDQGKALTRQKKNAFLNRIIYPVSALVALPTSVLSGFAALESDHGNLKALASINAVAQLIMKQSTTQVFYALLCLLATGVVLTGLNKKYLLGSTQSVFELIKSDILFLKNKASYKNVGARFLLIENGLFLWCFLTSLIFAELGKETMAFLGKTGELIGFYLNLLVYFATRYAGARRFFKNILEHNEPSEINRNTPILAIGYMFAFLSAIPIVVNFIPECVKGLQLLLHSNLNADPKYQNTTSLIIGLLATLPTVFFYSVSIKDLPKHLAKTVLLFKRNMKTGRHKKALWLLFLTTFAFAFSFFASIGFRLVGTSNIEQGYLSYLNVTFSSWMPCTLFIACTMMFWSHLQHLVNAR